MSYKRTYRSVGADSAPTTSIFNLVGMDKFIKVDQGGGLPTVWIVVGVTALVALGGLALARRKKKS